MELASELWASMAITGRLVVLILIALSFYSYYVMIDRLLALRAESERSNGFAAEVGDLGEVEQILSRASAAREQGPCALAAVIETGLREFKALREENQPEPVVIEGVDETVGRELDVTVMNLRKRLSGMATISGVAPFLGLFGTVTGLISAFRGIAETGSGGLATVSGGISEALVTTVIGLFVAIPALWAYNFFMNKIDVLGVELDNAASRVVGPLVRRSVRGSSAA